LTQTAGGGGGKRGDGEGGGSNLWGSMFLIKGRCFCTGKTCWWTTRGGEGKRRSNAERGKNAIKVFVETLPHMHESFCHLSQGGRNALTLLENCLVPSNCSVKRTGGGPETNKKEENHESDLKRNDLHGHGSLTGLAGPQVESEETGATKKTQ